jgi:Protein kinase domain
MRAILPRTPGRTPAANTAPALFPTGEIVGRYLVEAVIGLGGTGTVFRCLDRETERHVAVKAIPHDATLRRRAQREVEVARRLDHPNVVRLLDSARDDDYIYVISELVDGGDLGASMRAGALGDAALLRAVSATCAGLAHAHAAGIVHRDVKPANILLGGDGTVQLADFGIAMLVGPDATVDDRLLGTLSYMAPEICTGGTPTPAADIWSIGVMLYEAMTGANPYRSRSPAELADRHGERPRPLAEVRPDLGRPLAAACARALSRDPRRRPSAASLATVLESAADRLEAPPAARVVELHPRPAGRPRRFAAPKIQRPRVRVPHLSFDLGLAALGVGASSLRTSGVSAPLAERACAIARRVGPAAAASVAVEAVLRTFPFWPGSLIAPIAILCGGIALVAPWSAALLVLVVCVPALGNLSSALAWTFALLGALWLSVSAGSGRRALLPALAPAALAFLAFPAYLIAAGRLRSAPGRALAGAGGPLAIALWTARTHAASYAGTDDVAAVARALVHGAGAPLAGQALAWGAAAMAWPLAWSGWRIGRAPALAIWLGLALAAQTVVPATLGAAPETALRSVAAVAAAAILLALSVPARGDDA